MSPEAASAGHAHGTVLIEAPEMPPKTLPSPAAVRTGNLPPLSEYLRTHGIPLNTRCGGRGLCESCTVELHAGAVTHIPTGSLLTAGEHPLMVKACEVQIPSYAAPLTHIRVPPRSYLRYQPQIVTEYRINIPCGHDPLYQEIPLEGPLTPETIQQHFVDEAVQITPQAQQQAAKLSSLPGRKHMIIECTGEEWQVTTVEPAHARIPLGVAIDIGTTTVAILLADLTNGKVLSQAAMFNQQMNFGDDVVTRIHLCTHDKAMIKKLQHAIAEDTLRPLIDSALQHAGMTRDQIRCYSIAGNTTMLHLAAGVDPTSLGTAPFTPAFLAHTVLDAASVFTRGDSPGTVHLLPSAAGYVGADLTAGVVASGMLYDDGPSLLVDVGTNGEIILKHQGKFFGCATAAGPAFEGAGLSCGMRAGDGVIAYVKLQGHGESLRVHTETIGHPDDATAKTVGICGSAYIDFLAQARRINLLGVAGRFTPDFDARGHIIPWDNNRDKAFRLAFAPGKQPIVISQRDIAGLLQAKAAIAAGILTLLNTVGLKPADIKTVYVAGGFGTRMNAHNAISCGLLPGFIPAQILPVGNTALAGAFLALLDASLLREMRRVGETMNVIELNLDPGFEDRYIEQLALP